MMKIERKKSELLSEMEKRRRAKQPLDGIKGEFTKVTLYSHIDSWIKETKLCLNKIWNDNCQAHEAYQFFRKKNSDKYAGYVPAPSHSRL